MPNARNADGGRSQTNTARDGGAGGRSGGAGTAARDGGAGGRTGSGGTEAQSSGAGASGANGTAGEDVDAGMETSTPGMNLVAIDMLRRTYLDYVEVPASGRWTPEANGFPLLAQWESTSLAYSALRFQPFTPGDVLPPDAIIALLPRVAKAPRSISITDAPYDAKLAPADASDAIQAALDAAAAMAKPNDPVDVLVPAGTYDHSKVLTVGADVRLRRWPEASGGILHATDPQHAAIHLVGDRSGALFLVLDIGASARAAAAPASGVWVGSDRTGADVTHDALVVGTEVKASASAHFFGLAEDGGVWAFNYAHDGYADTFHHTGGSNACQVIGNRAQTSAMHGDDLYAFVGYQADADIVHHCSCIANSGRDGTARGLSAVGAGFMVFAYNDIDRVQWAGIYIAQEDSYKTYGSFHISVLHNTIAHANLAGSHDGLLAYSDSPADSHPAMSIGNVSNRIDDLTISNNTFRDTAAGIGNGFGIELRASVDTGEVSNNTLEHNQAPQLVIAGSNIRSSNNTVVP